MRTPVPSKACPEPGRRVEGFKLTDDCTLSGHRLHRDERRVEGGGYVDPAGGALVPAHGVVVVRAEGMKKGETEVPPDSYCSS